jgi:hypothetical protein
MVLNLAIFAHLSRFTSHGISLTGEFRQNFDLKNTISTCTQDFSWEKTPKSPDFEEDKNPDRQIFVINSSG